MCFWCLCVNACYCRLIDVMLWCFVWCQTVKRSYAVLWVVLWGVVVWIRFASFIRCVGQFTDEHGALMAILGPDQKRPKLFVLRWVKMKDKAVLVYGGCAKHLKKNLRPRSLDPQLMPVWLHSIDCIAYWPKGVFLKKFMEPYLQSSIHRPRFLRRTGHSINTQLTRLFGEEISGSSGAEERTHGHHHVRRGKCFGCIELGAKYCLEAQGNLHCDNHIKLLKKLASSLERTKASISQKPMAVQGVGNINRRSYYQEHHVDPTHSHQTSHLCFQRWSFVWKNRVDDPKST